MVRFAAASRRATGIRLRLAEQGEHIPSFLIASITSRCNLHCAGCYSRCSEATVDSEPVEQLTAEEWLRVFREAEELGVSFIMLAGGEPLLRWDIIEKAGTMQNILFPIFTNVTYMNGQYLALFDRCRNLIPVRASRWS
jgi:MoaA/NifB/PqqE/SkfB family radical SAM enzyme